MHLANATPWDHQTLGVAVKAVERIAMHGAVLVLYTIDLALQVLGELDAIGRIVCIGIQHRDNEVATGHPLPERRRLTMS